MHGTAEGRVRVKFSAAKDSVADVGFEPFGNRYQLLDADFIFLELPTAAVSQMEVVFWPNGPAVWLPFPGDYRVLNAEGELLDNL